MKQTWISRPLSLRKRTFRMRTQESDTCQKRSFFGLGQNVNRIARFKFFIGCQSEILKSGYALCPHYLGGGLGLAATAHLINGLGIPTMLELDVSENPFRELLFEMDKHLVGGKHSAWTGTGTWSCTGFGSTC